MNCYTCSTLLSLKVPVGASMPTKPFYTEANCIIAYVYCPLVAKTIVYTVTGGGV